MTRFRTPFRVKITLTLLLTMPCLGAQCDDVLYGPILQLRDLMTFEPAGYCRDWGLGEIAHPGQRCYRREGCVFNCPQVCEDSTGNRVNSLDRVSPVIGTNGNGYCIYDTPWDPWTGVAAHLPLWGHAILDVLFPDLLAPGR